MSAIKASRYCPLPIQDEFQLLVCSFSPDGTHIAAGGNDCHVYVWHWPLPAGAPGIGAASPQQAQQAGQRAQQGASSELAAMPWPHPQVCERAAWQGLQRLLWLGP